MSYVETAITRAIQGGWKPKTHSGVHEKPIVKVEVSDYLKSVELWFSYENGGGEFTRQQLDTIWLDPDFWKCLGKHEGWRKNKQERIIGIASHLVPTYLYHWHRLIETLANGGSAESYFKELLTK